MSLEIRLSAYAGLSATKASVGEFAGIINDARNIQQEKEYLVDEKSDLLEKQRIIFAKMMYANLGILMNKFSENPKHLERFFDLEVIRKGAPEDKKEEQGNTE